MESPDFAQALGQFAASLDEFDLWFKRRLAEVTGVDLNHPPPGPLSGPASLPARRTLRPNTKTV
jgi:hypothetical protein